MAQENRKTLLHVNSIKNTDVYEVPTKVPSCKNCKYITTRKENKQNTKKAKEKSEPLNAHFDRLPMH